MKGVKHYTKDGKEWKELSEIDKITLRDELTAKLSELQKKYGNDDKITVILPHTIQQINEQLEKEARRI